MTTDCKQPNHHDWVARTMKANVICWAITASFLYAKVLVAGAQNQESGLRDLLTSQHLPEEDLEERILVTALPGSTQLVAIKPSIVPATTVTVTVS
jgi:hypothetical protein